MRVLAIDPGYERLGLAVLEKENSQKENLIFSECFQTSKDLPFVQRLKSVGDKISQTIEKYSPDAVAVESLFFTKNQKTAMHVAEIRGVIMYEAARHGLRFEEFTPAQIKIAVTGDGHADKKQILFMTPRLVKIEKSVKYDDEFDAVAIALTFLASGVIHK